MGQAQVQAARDVTPSPVMAAHSSLSKHANELKQIAGISYEAFLQSIQELNKITHKFSDISGKSLVFQVKKDTDATVLWKGTVRIRCHKVNSQTGSIESSRILNLKQYMHLYNEINRQAAMIRSVPPDTNEQTPANLDASIIFTELDQRFAASGLVDTEEDECCICMDRKAHVILTCSHVYCEQCIDEWNLRGTPVEMLEYFFEHRSKPAKNTKHTVTFSPRHENPMAYDHAKFQQLLVKYSDVPPASGIESKPSQPMQNPDCTDSKPDIKVEET